MPLLISHSYNHIDLPGCKIGETILPISGNDPRSPEDIYSGKGFFHPGTGSAYHRCLYDKFAILRLNKLQMMQFLSGELFYSGGIHKDLIRVVHEVLVDYRVGSGTTTFIKHYRKGMVKGLRLCKFTQLLVEYFLLRGLSLGRLQHIKNILLLYEGRTFAERLTGYKETENGNYFSIQRVIFLCLLLPQKVGDSILDLLYVLKYPMTVFKLFFSKK